MFYLNFLRWELERWPSQVCFLIIIAPTNIKSKQRLCVYQCYNFAMQHYYMKVVAMTTHDHGHLRCVFLIITSSGFPYARLSRVDLEAKRNKGRDLEPRQIQARFRITQYCYYTVLSVFFPPLIINTSTVGLQQVTVSRVILGTTVVKLD